MNIRQVLVTFFNRRLDDNFKLALNEKWLQHRWSLFTAFTVPSIMAQTTSDFNWLILCHPQSPVWLREKTEALKELNDKFIFSFDLGEPELYYELKDPGVGAVLTSRVDSDDALSRRTLEHIHQSFVRAPFEFEMLELEVGYQYDWFSQRLALVKLSSPPFSTKINFGENCHPFDTGDNHSRHYELYKCTDICHGEPLFLQVMHSANLANRLSYTNEYFSRSLSRQVLKDAFNVQDPSRPMSFSSLLADFSWDIRKTLKYLVKNDEF